MPDTQSTQDFSPVEYQYASFWHRFAALFIDALILVIPHIVINHILPGAGSVLLVLFYKPVFESSPLMATPGKSLMGIIVVSEEGNRLSYKQALIRCFMSFVSGLCLMLGYFMSLFTAKHQALHDMVAQSIVIFQDMPKENYFDIWINEMRNIFGRGSSESFNSKAFNLRNDSSGGAGFSGPRSSKGAINPEAVEALAKLHKLLIDGAITEEEYAAKKAELLKRI